MCIRDRLVKLREAVGATNEASRASLRFLSSAHASLEELALLGQITRSLQGESADQKIAIGWRVSEKKQSAKTRFVVSALDAPTQRSASLPTASSRSRASRSRSSDRRSRPAGSA